MLISLPGLGWVRFGYVDVQEVRSGQVWMCWCSWARSGQVRLGWVGFGNIDVPGLGYIWQCWYPLVKALSSVFSLLVGHVTWWWQGSKLPKQENVFQNDFWDAYVSYQNFLFWNVGPIKITKKRNYIPKWFLDHIYCHQIFPFLGCGSHQISVFLVILINYVINNFLKGQFCFSRENKLLSFLVCLHNPIKISFFRIT